MKSLNQLNIGETAKILEIKTHPKTANRFMEMGLSIHSPIKLLTKLPFGGNLVILSEYGKYTLRKNTAQKIQVVL